jgi:hypothetical protein
LASLGGGWGWAFYYFFKSAKIHYFYAEYDLFQERKFSAPKVPFFQNIDPKAEAHKSS